jgi:hypothetical protein
MSQIQRLEENNVVEIDRIGSDVMFQNPTSGNEVWLTKSEIEQLIAELTEIKDKMI